MAKINPDLRAKDDKLPDINKVKRYDFAKPVRPANAFFQFIERLVGKIVMKDYKGLFSHSYLNFDKIPTPSLILGTHMSFLDMPTLLYATDPTRVNYVCALDAIHDYTEWLMRRVGIIGKRKFIQDFQLLKNMRYSARELKHCAVMIYPEARYSLHGGVSCYSPALGKLAKMLDTPVIVARLNGNYISDPQWRQQKFPCKLHAELELVVTLDEVRKLAQDEIQAKIDKAFEHDDLAWQKENNIIIDAPYRANGLNRLLYQCAECGTEFMMKGEGTTLTCNKCGKAWHMTELGELKALEGETRFSHIPDWFNWQKANVEQEVASGKYHFEDEVGVRTLPGAKRFYHHGVGKLTHSMDGFKLECNAYNVPTTEIWKPIDISGCHIEYNYKGVADCMDISTNTESYWLFPLNSRDVITKISLATDAMHAQALKQ